MQERPILEDKGRDTVLCALTDLEDPAIGIRSALLKPQRNGSALDVKEVVRELNVS